MLVNQMNQLTRVILLKLGALNKLDILASSEEALSSTLMSGLAVLGSRLGVPLICAAFFSIAFASLFLPLERSHLGHSGRQQ